MPENPLQELMRRGESGAAGYNAYNRGTYVGPDGREHVRGPDRHIDFTAMTIGSCSGCNICREIPRNACSQSASTR